MEDLTWWIENITSTSCLISHGNPDLTVTADASNTGWGGTLGTEETGGRWSVEEMDYHINYLEILAIFLTLCSLCRDYRDVHIRVMTDNTTAMAYVNSMGGKKSMCNDVTRTLWCWCKERNIWLSAAHIPGILNVQADRQSRLEHDHTEWMLNEAVFLDICEVYGLPTVDLFASRLNHQVEHYVSWKPDPGAMAVDAWGINWAEHWFYAFPPFNQIAKCLQKIVLDKAEGIIIAPVWPTQPWFSRLTQMLTNCPLLLPRKNRLLTLPHKPDQHHPLNKMRLAAFQVSGIPSKGKEFRLKLQTLSCVLGEHQPRINIPHTLEDGWTFQVDKIVIHMHHL